MKNVKLHFTKENLTISFMYVLIGALFCFFRSGVLGILLTIAGALFVLSGLAQIFIKKEPTSGLIALVIGVVIILGAWLFAEIVMIVFGALLILKGAADLVTALQAKGLFLILAAAFEIALGVLLILYRVLLLDWMFIIIGVFFIVSGILFLFTEDPAKKK